MSIKKLKALTFEYELWIYIKTKVLQNTDTKSIIHNIRGPWMILFHSYVQTVFHYLGLLYGHMNYYNIVSSHWRALGSKIRLWVRSSNADGQKYLWSKREHQSVYNSCRVKYKIKNWSHIHDTFTSEESLSRGISLKEAFTTNKYRKHHLQFRK